MVRVVCIDNKLDGERESERRGKLVVVRIRIVRISWLLYISGGCFRRSDYFLCIDARGSRFMRWVLVAGKCLVCNLK